MKVSRLAYLIAQQEGFFRPGTLPARRHNPGDLRHSPHSSHEGIGANDIGIIPNDQLGWQDLERQIRLDAGRGLTLSAFVEKYAPAEENNTASYLTALCVKLPATHEARLADLLADLPQVEVLKTPASERLACKLKSFEHMREATVERLSKRFQFLKGRKETT